MTQEEFDKALQYITSLLREIKKRGFTFNINYEGEDFYDGDDVDQALKMIWNLDMCWLNAMQKGDDGYTAAFLIIIQDYNDVEEVVADYSANPTAEAILESIAT